MSLRQPVLIVAPGGATLKPWRPHHHWRACGRGGERLPSPLLAGAPPRQRQAARSAARDAQAVVAGLWLCGCTSGLISRIPRATKRWLHNCVVHQTRLASTATSAPAEAPLSSGEGDEEEPVIARYSSCVGGRSRIGRILNSPDDGKSFIGKQVTVCGWVKTMRAQKEFAFMEVNDGSCFANLQVVISQTAAGFQALQGSCGTGASVKCVGRIVEPPEGAKQSVELRIAEAEGDEISLFGSVDSKDYPMAKARLKVEFLRELAHLRPRSNLIAAVARVRAALALATHQFFGSRGFLYVHTPLITAADCEGGGEMFQVTTMLGEIESSGVPKTKAGKIDYSKDFFKKPAYLTVSGQLSVENYCCALSSVYTFGPTFRAENSNTSRHLAEFWMIEPELAFADINDDMDCAEDYLKYCIQWVMDKNLEDLKFFDLRVEKGLIARLQNLLAEPFARITYTEAIEILQKDSKKAKFEVPVEWGMDLGSEHERYLAEKVYKKPTIVYNYPKDIKAFYMRLNEDDKTVAAMDVLAPAVGEVIGGSQREERLDVLDRRMEEMKLDAKDYWWYRDLRRFGTVPHAGFGLGFERLIMLTTGVSNIRDVIPYPRYPGHAEF